MPIETIIAAVVMIALGAVVAVVARRQKVEEGPIDDETEEHWMWAIK